MPVSPAGLVLSQDVTVEDLVSDIPFFAVGVLAFAVLTLLLVKRRLTELASMIGLSTFFAFIGAIIDFARLLDTNVNDKHIATIVAREMIFAASITLRFLFFWTAVAQPARGESIQTAPTGASYLPADDDMVHSGSWTRWGVMGLILKYFMLLAVVSIGVLEAIARISWAFSSQAMFGALSTASLTVQLGASVIFGLKLIGNLLFTPLLRRPSVLVDYIPLLSALALSIGIAVGNLICYRFSEYPLGRLLQALILYILLLYVAIVAFDNLAPHSSAEITTAMRTVPDSKTPRNQNQGIVTSDQESFAGVRIITPEGLRPPIPKRPALSGLLDNRTSTERLASWVSRRISGRPDPDEEDVRLWNGQRPGDADLEQGLKKGPIALSSPDDEKPSATQAMSIYSYYGRSSVDVQDGDLSKDPRVPRSSTASTLIATRKLPVPPLPQINVSYAKSLAGIDSPVYGLNGARASSPALPRPPLSPIVASSEETIPTIATKGSSSDESDDKATAMIRQAQVDLDRSIADLKSTIQPLSPTAPSYRTNTPSLRSFSLEKFPVPPRRPDLGLSPLRDSFLSVGPSEAGENEDDNDVLFELVPPRMPAAQEAAIARQSAFSDSSEGLPSTLFSSEGTSLRYPGREITSFIDGVVDQSSPIVGRHQVNDSVDRRPEDLDVVTSPQALGRTPMPLSPRAQPQLPTPTSPMIPIRSAAAVVTPRRPAVRQREGSADGFIPLPMNPRPVRTYTPESTATSLPRLRAPLGTVDTTDISRPIPIASSTQVNEDQSFQSPRPAPRTR